MPAERVDYYSDDEFRQAQQQESYEAQEAQAAQDMDRYSDACLCDLITLIKKYDFQTVAHCLPEAKLIIEEPKDPELPF